jgi:hypothetical protein
VKVYLHENVFSEVAEKVVNHFHFLEWVAFGDLEGSIGLQIGKTFFDLVGSVVCIFVGGVRNEGFEVEDADFISHVSPDHKIF